ncbi:hypothetical protein SDC9_129378 [bioreactor metagenome]|uniref:Uncharacterized protein n=1 Tax=bioreactor metagenome TaxID=1076179 RepID=A0A645CZG3_9ZZZZ
MDIQLGKVGPLMIEIKILQQVGILLKERSLGIGQGQRFIVLFLPVFVGVDLGIADVLRPAVLGEHGHSQPDRTVRGRDIISALPVFGNELHVVIKHKHVRLMNHIK